MSKRAGTSGAFLSRLAMERTQDGLTRTGVSLPNFGGRYGKVQWIAKC